MIKILDSFTADKIAAGEVIERPVSVVKELVENSIDAGSDSVIVEIRGGGISYIRITDNGSGISSDEIETAFKRHATSKISNITDLDNINSLGFRGEALASISAVSRLTIVSRAEGESAGTKMIMHAGKVVSKEKVGTNKGTTIIVEDLFYNTPARRKFMKTEARESSAIIELIQQYAICYFDIKFMMVSNGESLFTTSGSGRCKEIIESLYPDKAHSNLLPMRGIHVKGFISPPGTTSNSRKSQLFYVNGRLVSSKVIGKALEDGYAGRLFSGHPAAILFIDVDPHDIDVNIHPGKREILFLHADEIASDIKASVINAISGESSVPVVLSSSGQEPALSVMKYDYSDSCEPEESLSEQSSIEDYLASFERPYSDKSAFGNKESLNFTDDESECCEDSSSDTHPSEPHRSLFDKLVLKGYIFDTYIITEYSDSVYVFDQHAAHERIFYEKLMGVYTGDEKFSQPILSPIALNVSSDVYRLKDDIISIMGKLGYDIADFGPGSFIIRAIPSYMSAEEASQFAETFCNSEDITDIINKTVVDKIIMKSCKSAVKGGDKLTEYEINSLLYDLSKCDNPYSCPHGRPTFIKITRYETEKAFKRK